jgi:Helix-hairpin-helix domain
VSLPDMQRRVVEMLPGCGRVIARELLQRFGSIERIAAASPAELCALKGIGQKKAAAMLAVLTAEYAAFDTERQIEDATELYLCLLFEGPVSCSRANCTSGPTTATWSTWCSTTRPWTRSSWSSSSAGAWSRPTASSCGATSTSRASRV